MAYFSKLNRWPTRFLESPREADRTLSPEIITLCSLNFDFRENSHQTSSQLVATALCVLDGTGCSQDDPLLSIDPHLGPCVGKPN